VREAAISAARASSMYRWWDANARSIPIFPNRTPPPPVTCQFLFGNARVENASSGNGRESSEYVECSFDGVSPPADYTKLGTDAVNAVVALLTDG
jgi:hypothetical protein